MILGLGGGGGGTGSQRESSERNSGGSGTLITIFFCFYSYGAKTGPHALVMTFLFPEWQVPVPSAHPQTGQDCARTTGAVASRLGPTCPHHHLLEYKSDSINPSWKFTSSWLLAVVQRSQLPGVAFKAPAVWPQGHSLFSLQRPPWGALGTKTRCHSFMCNRWFHPLYISHAVPTHTHQESPFPLLPHLYSFLATHTSSLRITFSGKLSMTYFVSLFKLLGLSQIFHNFLKALLRNHLVF